MIDVRKMGWLYKINIWDLIKEYDDRERNGWESPQQEQELVQSISKRVAERIRKLKSVISHDQGLRNELEEIAKRFEEEVFDKGDFNSVLSDFYDLGDCNRRIWINNIASTKIETRENIVTRCRKENILTAHNILTGWDDWELDTIYLRCKSCGNMIEITNIEEVSIHDK